MHASTQLARAGRNKDEGKSSNAAASSSSAGAMSDTTLQAVTQSKDQLIKDMRVLLSEAQRYFGDVCWRLEGDDEILYGHRAILYARANAAFQTRFLNPSGSARLQAIMSGSTLSLMPPASPRSMQKDLQHLSIHSHYTSRPSSPATQSVYSNTSRGAAPAANGASSPIHISGTDSAFFKSLLDFFYTASTPMDEVFTFLFEDSSFTDKEDALDRLSQDLLFMWRSKLFADVHVQLADLNTVEGEDKGSSDSLATADEKTIFPAHRAILASRCTYFSDILLSPYLDADSTLFTLPSPPFTPTALHFTLAYLYTGSFSALTRTFDLAVAMDLWKCALYLGHDVMHREIEARIEDMCHNFRACCKTCRHRCTRIFVFASEPDVNAKSLQQNARAVVLDRFDETWPTKEIGTLPYEVQKELLVEKCARTGPSNAAGVMKGIIQIRSRLASERGARWADHVRSMIIPLEDRIKHILKHTFDEVAASKSFIELIEGIGFSNDVLEMLLSLTIQSVTEKTAASIYELLVGKLLLREEGITMDARARLEDARQALLQYIKARWVGIRLQNGFERLENWCLKELSDELEQSVDDLLESTTSTPRPITKSGLRLSATKVHKVESDTVSVASAPHSLRASILKRTAVRNTVTRTASSDSLVAKHPLNTPNSLSSSKDAHMTSAPSLTTDVESLVRNSDSSDQVQGGTALNSTSSSNQRRSATILSSRTIVPAVPTAQSCRPMPDTATTSRSLATTSTPRRTPIGPKMTKSARLRISSTASKTSLASNAGVSPASSTTSKSIRRDPSNTAAGGRQATNLASPPGSSRPASLASIRSRKSLASTLNFDKASTKSQVRSTRPDIAQSIENTKENSRKTSIHRNLLNADIGSTTPIEGDRSPAGSPVTPVVREPSSRAAPGSTLRVGIPCVVTHQKTKFRATVRYLGETYFGEGSFVGVEVMTVGEDLPSDLDWNDGSVDNVKYFDLEATRPSTPLEDRLSARAKRRPNMRYPKEIASIGSSSTPGRGLFVRPSQVLYVF